jgi:hypothetical protein
MAVKLTMVQSPEGAVRARRFDYPPIPAIVRNRVSPALRGTGCNVASREDRGCNLTDRYPEWPVGPESSSIC